MPKGVSTSINKEEREALARAFAQEGPCSFEYATAFKFRAYDGHYVVVRLEPPGQDPFYADLARGAKGDTYQFQNDSLEFTEEQWAKLRIPADCDWFEVPDPVMEETSND